MGILALIKPVITSTEGRCVAKIKWIPAALAYIENVVQSNTSSFSLSESDEEDYDELYDQAVSVVTESRKASISLVQRRLKIGYNRAARLIEKMESEGVVSAMQSNGTREVIAPPVVE